MHKINEKNKFNRIKIMKNKSNEDLQFVILIKKSEKIIELNEGIVRNQKIWFYFKINKKETDYVVLHS